MFVNVLERVPRAKTRNPRTELLLELTPQRPLSRFAELDASAERPHAFDPAQAVFDFAQQKLIAAPRKADHFYPDRRRRLPDRHSASSIFWLAPRNRSTV